MYFGLKTAEQTFPKAPVSFSSVFRIGGLAVELCGDCPADVKLLPSLEPFRVSSEPCDIRIRVEWSKRLRAKSGCRLFDSGSLWKLYQRADGFQFDFEVLRLCEHPYRRLWVDSSFRNATLQMSEEGFAKIPYDPEPLEYPLDELLIMHRLTQEKAIELHGCGIVRDGIGNLFVGHSGAGKSTTTRLWTTREDVEVLSDDRIIVRRDEGRQEAAAETPIGATGTAGEHGVLRLRDCSASRNNHSAQDDRKGKLRMYGTPWHGEAMHASPASAPLARILVLEHGHGNVLTQLSPSQAAAELFARAFVPFHRHEYVESALQFLEEVVDAVPCYRYAFEPNQSAVERILEIRD